MASPSRFPENKPMDALSAAKSCYNIVSLNQTNDAIGTLSLCLTLAQPADKTITRSIRAETGTVWAANAYILGSRDKK